MPEKSTGRNDLIRQVDERFETDSFGVDMVALRVKIPDASFPNQVLAPFASHPRFTNMVLARRSGARSTPGWWDVNYTFEGFLFDMPEPVYELAGSLDQEPIQAHPDFVSKIAGSPASPLNGAIFVAPETGLPTTDNAVGVFREFKATIEGAVNKKGGIESYLVPGAEWKVTEFSGSPPSSLRNLGKIDSPQGPSPGLSGRNWLAWSQSYVRRGGIFQITSTWKLSGRNGWDSDIY